ncbi:hypothetical protein E1B28_006067 [Marasmius oreades]|uniref:lytic cellulose monooxygenase (C4-dehydrogenating) n=1 Tax=Marasmius oreades TaxID=181124 RepID=A0A9P7UVG7_9AGAR|nr:uncharacterized protein E1B28_006067 [Marasmius oreades]KAG7095300.1 hypothetical protein E1B28_006067 [Marasmius oreades]
MFKNIVISLLLSTYVSAHGYIASVDINGKHFPGNVPNGETKPSIIRQIGDVSPVKGATNKDLFCGINEQVASDLTTANPGDTISFDWRGGDNSLWPHNTGPMLTYMASCGPDPCNKFDDRNAKWFKIQQVGRKGKGQEWAQQDLMKGAVATIKLPSTLAPGNYLIRHEIIALHLAESDGGAEFYPGCAQITVGGNQNGRPKDEETVVFPGGYHDQDPGILVPNAFDANADYNFPGPAIARFVTDSPSNGGSNSGNGQGSGSSNGSGSGTTSPNGGNNGTTSDPSGSSSSSHAPSSQGTCRLKKRGVAVFKRAQYQDYERSDVVRIYRPKHISRIMRNLLSRRGFDMAPVDS